MLRPKFGVMGATSVSIFHMRKQASESYLLKELILFARVFLVLSAFYTTEKVLNKIVCALCVCMCVYVWGVCVCVHFILKKGFSNRTRERKLE